MKRVLIIGASGFLGKELYMTFGDDGDYETYGTYSTRNAENLEFLSLRDSDNIEEVFLNLKPDIVIITAALTNVEYCENHKEETYEINVSGIEKISKTCKQYGCRVVYISTEYVFDGESGPYAEEDDVRAINYYGETKLIAEQIIQKEIEDCLIVRTTVVYGWDLDSKNFIMQMLKNHDCGKMMKIPVDQISSPTYCPNLSSMIKECCDKSIDGIINLVGCEVMGRYEFAVRACEALDIDPKMLIPVETSNLNQTAKRPMNAGLKTDRAFKLLENKPENLEESLYRLKKIYEDYKNTVR